MITFVGRRLLQTVLVLILALTLAFVLIRLSGDPTLLMVPDNAPLERIEELREQMGFDRPIHIQYLEFMVGAVQGDFGESYRYRESAFRLVLERFPATIQLAAGAILLSSLLGITFGLLGAVRRDTWVDHLVNTAAVIGVSIPVFWVGLVAILIFSVQFDILPTGGRGSWKHFILPVAVLAVEPLAYITKLSRSAVLDVLGADYVRTAHSKGLRERIVLSKHVLRNALIPVVTYIGLQVSSLLGGAVVIETIFAWPGVGRFIFNSLGTRDFPVVQVGIVTIAFIVAAVNLLVDLSYAWLDPRVTYS